jgi:sugar O-acyltransferase (sialic acid O-acetyltransferase NeuD family)
MVITNVLVPLINANEPEAKLVEIHVNNDQLVKQGDVLFSLETTKATAEVEAPNTGYFHLMAEQGNIYSVGDLLAVITENKDDEILSKQPTYDHENGSIIRITQPARLLAEQLGIDINHLPIDRLVTESIIYELAAYIPFELPVSITINPEKSILVYGAGGHAKSVMDMVRSIGKFEIIGIVDDNVSAGTSVMGTPVIGSRIILEGLRKKGLLNTTNGVGGILDISSRVKVFDLLEKYSFTIPTIIHPCAWVEESARVEKGVQVFANSYVGSEVSLQPYCMINTNAVVSHDCIIGTYSHIAPGALLAGHVEVGERSLIGMGVKTAIGIKIGNNVRIGNGAIINADVPSKSIVPAGRIWSG